MLSTLSIYIYIYILNNNLESEGRCLLLNLKVSKVSDDGFLDTSYRASWDKRFKI